MGIWDILWPFNKKFADIPCAREAALISLGGGPILGAVVIIVTRNPKLGFNTTIYSGFGLFWASFIAYRFDMATKKQVTKEFHEALKEGRIE